MSTKNAGDLMNTACRPATGRWLIPLPRTFVIPDGTRMLHTMIFSAPEDVTQSFVSDMRARLSVVDENSVKILIPAKFPTQNNTYEFELGVSLDDEGDELVRRAFSVMCLYLSHNDCEDFARRLKVIEKLRETEWYRKCKTTKGVAHEVVTYQNGQHPIFQKHGFSGSIFKS